jgi:hypothetical protein
MIFAREITGPLTSLVKKIDAANAKHANMGSFVVFLSDEEKLADQAKALADKEGLKKTVLAIDNTAGPQGYNVARDAEVTVVFYNKRNVKANFAFKKGELNEQAVEKVVNSLSKIVSK